MHKDSHSELKTQLSELSAEIFTRRKDTDPSSPLGKILHANSPCDPKLNDALETLFQARPKGQQEWLRMQTDALRRVSRSRETQQIFRAYGVLELVTPVRQEGKIVHALFSGPLKISPWTPQEKETLATICSLQVRELPPSLTDAAIYSPSQVEMLIRQQTREAECIAQMASQALTTETKADPLPSSLGMDLLQPGFADHLDLLFQTVQQELRKPPPLTPASSLRMQTAMQRGRHLTEQIRQLSQGTFQTLGEHSVHGILEQWKDQFCHQHPALRINLRLEAERDRVTANPHQLQHMLFTLMASVADGLPEGRAVMGLSTRNMIKEGEDLLHLEIRDGGGLATFAGTGGESDQQALLEQNEAAQEFSDWFTLASRMDAELQLLRDEGIVTRAELYLPLHAAEKMETPGSDAGGHNLWIVEDDDREYESLLHMLQQTDFQCVRYTSAADLRDNFSLASSPPDLVLLKYYLPDQRGAEVRSWLYEQDPALPVILISGLQATHPGIATANSIPSTLYLQKPFDSQSLLDMVKMNLDETLPG